MTIFTKIINREIPADIVYEDDHVLAFRDIAPKAKVHILIIPKIEVATLDDISIDTVECIKHIFLAIPKIAEQEGISQGYKVVSNCGKDGGQEVFHLHFHLLGGSKIDLRSI